MWMRTNFLSDWTHFSKASHTPLQGYEILSRQLESTIIHQNFNHCSSYKQNYFIFYSFHILRGNYKQSLNNPSLWPGGIGSRLGLRVTTTIPAWDGTGCEFDSWQCRIYIPCSLSLRLLGSLRGSLGTYGLTQKLCLKEIERIINLSPSCTDAHVEFRLPCETCFDELDIGYSSPKPFILKMFIFCTLS